MTIKCADSAGFCFGVKRAVDTVYDLLAKENHKVYTLGPIIHNEQVVEDLASQGVQVNTRMKLQKKTGVRRF